MATNETNAVSQPTMYDVDTSNWPRVDRRFHDNHDPEDLIRYQGNWVAWSLDGRRVLAASSDPYKLCEIIDQAGLKRGHYVLGGIPPDGSDSEPLLEILR